MDLNKVLIKNGLCYESWKTSRSIQGRVIFPIHTIRKRSTFGGRILSSNSKLAKPVTHLVEIYHKQQAPWHLFCQKKHCKEVVALVEGYTDVISMHQAGVKM